LANRKGRKGRKRREWRKRRKGRKLEVIGSYRSKSDMESNQ
jgi:hypothetical protein